MDKKMQNILVTGGAGYIGSHMLLALLDAGYTNIVVVDDLSTGVRRAVPDGLAFIEGNVGERGLMDAVLRNYAIDTVFHFAGSISVSESVNHPEKYMENNANVSCRLTSACLDAGVARFVFSSTAAVYAPCGEPITEDGILAPTTPYGESKLTVEKGLARRAAENTDFQYGILRYFNVIGADAAGRAGLWGTGESLMQFANDAALGKRDFLEIFGVDYDTADGTAVRDFIHVSDLVTAHVALGEAMCAGDENYLLNVGYGAGHSVREIVAAYGDVLRRDLPTRDMPRRAGDLGCVVADVSALKAALDWRPVYDGDLMGMVRSGYAWARKCT